MPSGPVARRVGRHTGKAALAAALLVIGAPPVAAQLTVGPPEFTGRWSAPFEEGGLDTPICESDQDGHLSCKPVAQASGVLPDGRVLYFDGLEGQENSGRGALDESSAIRNSTSRVLDLRSGTPAWSTPTNPTGGASNSSITPGRTAPGSPGDAAGVAGAPGRPGDGLVGSTAGQAGAPPLSPTAPPDDKDGNDGDMYCADVASLPDGRLLVAGGSDWYDEPGVDAGQKEMAVHAGVSESEGLRAARIFDPRTDTFSATGPMKYHRWYPAMVTLPDGRVLVAGGATKRVKNTQLSGIRRTETYDPASGTWTENYNGSESEATLPLSPRLHLMPNGKILYTGAGQGWSPDGAAADEALYSVLQFYDAATAKWSVFGPHLLGARDGAASVLLPLDPPYERATVLTFGGTLGPPPGTEAGQSLSTLTMVDKEGNVKEKLTRYNMLEGRWFPSAVGLPDGTVLAMGGATTSDTVAPGTGLAVRTTELYDPRTQTWYQMARTNRDHTYHHSAVLLADGRVLFGGQAPPGALLGPGDLGGPFPNNDRDPSFEIFSPHYLFRGPRPIVRHVPAAVRWGEVFEVTTRQALSIDSVVLSRLPSPQHSIDSDARTINLAFARHSGGLHVSAPPDGTIAPPGYYYLFVNRQTSRGPVPSMARIIRVGDRSDPSEAVQPFPDDRPTGGAAHDDVNSSPLAPVEKRMPPFAGQKSSAPAPVTPPSDAAARRVPADAPRDQVVSALPAAARRIPSRVPGAALVALAAGAAMGIGTRRRSR
jgi:Domain of unknown function (DUF1929)